MNKNENHRSLGEADKFMNIKREIITIIEESRYTELSSEIIFDEIFGKTFYKEIVSAMRSQISRRRSGLAPYY